MYNCSPLPIPPRGVGTGPRLSTLKYIAPLSRKIEKMAPMDRVSGKTNPPVASLPPLNNGVGYKSESFFIKCGGSAWDRFSPRVRLITNAALERVMGVNKKVQWRLF